MDPEAGSTCCCSSGAKSQVTVPVVIFLAPVVDPRRQIRYSSAPLSFDPEAPLRPLLESLVGIPWPC